MEWEHKEQLNTIQNIVTLNANKLNAITEGIETELLQSFYEEEIINETGKLHHLNNDEKLKFYFNNLETEEKDLLEEVEEESRIGNVEEFSNKSF